MLVARVVKTPFLRLPLVNKKSAFVLSSKASESDVKVRHYEFFLLGLIFVL